MKILAIDTSNQVMSIAATENQRVIGEYTTNIKKNHGERLMPAIDSLLKDVNWKPAELDRIVVAKGPGSYTGLRIGVTVAKTLAWTLKKEIAGVSSLEVLAGNREQSPNYLIPLFDARRGNIYTGLYQWQAGKLVQVESDTHISAEKWASYLSTKSGNFELLGEDKERFTSVFEKVLSGRLEESPWKDQLPKASVLGLLGMKKEAEDVHTFIPDYLKLAEAEENWRREHPNQLEETYVEKI